jgi:pyrimidine-nucleoside phosphorylase
MPSPVETIIRKRDGQRLGRDEIARLVSDYTSGKVADYQMSAWLMASFLRGLDESETLALTDAMLHSGEVLTLPSVKRPKIDKHSTGGVGDKISICLAPLVAACGVAVPMISGRGLGHTGGTLDKLEAIPGYRVDISRRAFERTVRTLGVSMIGQTPKLAPADRLIYALRDVTGTVESVPLIVASILSKKLAEGIDGLVLDVKAGRGAFMKTLPAARTLAKALVRVGRRAGKRVVALLTDMEVPIGRTIGNALETREAIDVLRGEGPEDTRELTLALGAEMLLLGNAAKTKPEAMKRLEAAIADGSAFECFVAMVRAHGGDARAVEDPSRLPRPRFRAPVFAPEQGYVTRADPLELGLVSVALGAGRVRTDDRVDPAAGIELTAVVGDAVERRQPLAWLCSSRGQPSSELVARAARAFRIGKRRPAHRALVLERIAR